MDPRNARNAPGIVLYEGSERRLYGSSIDDSLTPLDAMASPAVFYQQQAVPKGYRHHGAKSEAAPGTPTHMFGANNEPPAMYPDEGSTGRLAFLRQTNTQILICVALGVLVGILLSSLDVPDDLSELVNLPGRIFLRVLKCFVIPMVFCCLATGVANVVLLGNISAIGTRTAVYFLSFSGAAATLSLAVSMLLRPLNLRGEFEPPMKAKAFMHIACPNRQFLQQGVDGRVNCTGSQMDNSTSFHLIDLTGAIVVGGTVQSVTIRDQVTQILQSIFPSNIFTSFEDGTLMSVIAFAITFGVAAIKTGVPQEQQRQRQQQQQQEQQHASPLLAILNQMNKIFVFVISKLIAWSPIAVLSLIAGSLSSQESLSDVMRHVGVLVLSNLLTVATFELGLCPLVLGLVTRQSPFRYMRRMLPCAYFAFGCASSIATLPVTLRCVESTREVSRGLLRFVVTLGATLHMNGTAMLFPNAVVFLATTSKAGVPPLGWAEGLLVVVASLLGSLGVPPVPNGSLVMVFSIWSTVFPDAEMPASYSLLVAMNWYLDRMETACNVLGDTYVARIIAEQVEAEEEADA